MSNSYAQTVNSNAVPPQVFFIPQKREDAIDSILKRKHERRRYDFLSQESYINFFSKNWDNVDKLNEKFDELREKEREETITAFEKYLLYDVITKRILEFPNPYLPKDYEEGRELIEKYSRIEKIFDRKYKRNRFGKFFNTISSWLF